MDNAKTVETIRALCKKKKTSLTRLEEKLGFSNGYIGKMAKRPNSPPYDKLVAIANELGVTVADLTGEKPEQKEKTINQMADGLTEEKRKAIEIIMNASDENARKYLRMIETFEGIE